MNQLPATHVVLGAGPVGRSVVPLGSYCRLGTFAGYAVVSQNSCWPLPRWSAAGC